MSNSSLTSLKLSFNGEIRRLSVETDSLTYQDLVTKTLSVFPQLTAVQFSWVDDEDDKVTINSDEELAEALRVMTGTKKGYLRFDVHVMKGSPDEADIDKTSPLSASCKVNREQGRCDRFFVAKAAADKAKALGSGQDGRYQSIQRGKSRAQVARATKKDYRDRPFVAQAAASKAKTFGFGQDGCYQSTRRQGGAQVNRMKSAAEIKEKDCWSHSFVARAAADKAKTFGSAQDDRYQSTRKNEGCTSRRSVDQTSVKKEKDCWSRSFVAQAAADKAKSFGFGQNKCCQYTCKGRAGLRKNTLLSDCARWSYELQILAAMGFSDTNKVIPVLKTHIVVPESERTKGVKSSHTEGLQAAVLALVSCAE